jgi:putative ATP-binding cassette transporter
MMAVGAFNQVHSSLRWFINNIGAIADWRATLLRVSAFRLALLDTDKPHGEEDRLEVKENTGKTLTLERLDVVSPAGCTRLEELKAEIEQGNAS